MQNDRKHLDPDNTYVWATDWNVLLASMKQEKSQRHGNRRPLDATLVANLDQAPSIAQSVRFDCNALIQANTGLTNADACVDTIAADVQRSHALADIACVDAYFADLQRQSALMGTMVIEVTPVTCEDAHDEPELDLELGLLEAVNDLSRIMCRTKPRRSNTAPSEA